MARQKAIEIGIDLDTDDLVFVTPKGLQAAPGAGLQAPHWDVPFARRNVYSVIFHLTDGHESTAAPRFRYDQIAKHDAPFGTAEEKQDRQETFHLLDYPWFTHRQTDQPPETGLDLSLAFSLCVCVLCCRFHSVVAQAGDLTFIKQSCVHYGTANRLAQDRWVLFCMLAPKHLERRAITDQAQMGRQKHSNNQARPGTALRESRTEFESLTSFLLLCMLCVLSFLGASLAKHTANGVVCTFPVWSGGLRSGRWRTCCRTSARPSPLRFDRRWQR